MPEKIEDYKVKFKEGYTIDEKFSKAFTENAHKLGILPKQAQKLAEWFSDLNIAEEQSLIAAQKTNFEKMVGDLKKEWGNSFDLEVGRANKVIQELGGKELYDHMNKLGIGADANMMKFLAKVGGALYGEHKIVEGQGTSSTMSPKELDAEIKKLQAEPGYFDKNHPRHKTIVEEVQALYAKRYPNAIDKK